MKKEEKKEDKLGSDVYYGKNMKKETQILRELLILLLKKEERKHQEAYNNLENETKQQKAWKDTYWVTYLQPIGITIQIVNGDSIPPCGH